MNGPQDVGGQMGFGPVRPEPDEPPFHAEWEARALGLTLATGALGHWNIDESRHARESLAPAVYYASSYYEIWICALEALIDRHGLLRDDATDPPRARLSAEAVPGALAAGTDYTRPVAAPPRFRPGDRVRARNIHPRGHTRLPRYVRGRVGTVSDAHGGFILPDAHAHGRGEAPERLYTVVFDGAELWGPDGEPGLSVSVDAWESYLEPA
jgi:nitrile hydratase subunit beta